MKNIIIGILWIGTVSFGFAQKKKDLIKELEQLKSEVQALKVENGTLLEEKKVDLEDPQQKLSYSLGVSMASNVIGQGIDIHPNAFRQAIEDVKKEDTKFSVDECNRYFQDEFNRIMEEKAAAAKAEGDKFLAENKEKEGVKVTESGLQYRVIHSGNGAKPKSSDRVKVHYKGHLLDGKVFDSSYDRGEPAVFGVGQVIRGWTEALQLMSVGDKWELFIPEDLAYGQRGAGADIPPYATLIFEVELLDIEK